MIRFLFEKALENKEARKYKSTHVFGVVPRFTIADLTMATTLGGASVIRTSEVTFADAGSEDLIDCWNDTAWIS